MQPQNTNSNPSPNPVRPVGAAGAAGAARPVRPVVRRPVAVGGASAAPATPVLEPEPVKDGGPSFDNGPSVVGKKERKTGWVLAIILLLLIAAGGVGFGVWMWMDGNTQKEALNNQIGSLMAQNNNLQAQIDELSEQQSKNKMVTNNNQSDELEDSVALSLLQDAVANGGYDYTIDSATVYAKYNGDDKIAYWVKYIEVSDDSSKNDLNVIFIEDENGDWSFELPGFSGYTEELVSQYTVL